MPRKEVIKVPTEMLTRSEQVVEALPGRLRSLLDNPHVRVGLLTVAALLVEAVVAWTVLDVELALSALLAPFFVFTAYKVSGQRGRTAELVASVAVVVAATAVLLAYGL